MLDHQDEIATSYRRSCTDLKERLRIGLDKIYCSYKESYGENFTHQYENYIETAFDSLVTFERRLHQYIRVKHEFQSENKTLQMIIKDLQLDVKAKNMCLLKLKNDVASHYVQIEFLREHNRKLESDLENKRRKLEQFQKSQDWLKKYLVSAQMTPKCEDKIGRMFRNKSCVNKEEKQSLSSIIKREEDNDDFAKSYEGLEEWKIFHTTLIKMCYENSFLKQALRKYENMNIREANLNAILKSGNENSKIIKSKDINENKTFLSTRRNDAVKYEHSQELNTIIERLTLKLLQMRFEKENMNLSAYKILENFLKIKEIHAKFKLKICPNINSSTFSESEKVSPSSEYNDRTLSTDEKLIKESVTDLKCLQSEKLQMEIEHHKELSVFTEKFGNMQHILDSMKEVCENISEDGSIELSPESSSKGELNKQKNEEMKCSPLDGNFDKKQKAINAINDHFLPKIKAIKEKYRKIDSVSSENLRIMKKLDCQTLILELRNLKVEVMVKSKQLREQTNRFEKYKRFLLNSVKQYKQSSITKEKENGKLQSMFIAIVPELKLMMNYISENKQYLQTPDSVYGQTNKKFFDDALQRMDTIIEGIHRNVKSDLFSSTSTHNHSTSSNRSSLGDHSKSGLMDLVCSNDTEDSSVQTAKKIVSLREEIDVSHSVIEKLRKDKSILEADIRQREILLGKIFNIFKQRVEGMTVNVNEKHFLHRLCNDLRSVNKIYGGQNKVMREVLEDNNICTKSIFLRKLNKCSTNKREDYIKELLKQQKDFFKIKDDFSDIQFHLESMKRDVSFLQNIVSKNES